MPGMAAAPRPVIGPPAVGGTGVLAVGTDDDAADPAAPDPAAADAWSAPAGAMSGIGNVAGARCRTAAPMTPGRLP